MKLLVNVFAPIFLILLSIVDFRRGFLFSKNEYISPFPFFAFNYWQLIMISVGILGLAWGLKKIKKIELSDKQINIFLLSLFLILITDLFLYRGVATARSIDAGKIKTDWLNAFGTTSVWQPVALTASYILTVWHALFLSCLFSGFAFICLPKLQGYIQKKQQRFNSVFWGGVLALTQPLCSCCAAFCVPATLGKSRSVGFGSSLLLGAPLLNISTLILALVFLPIQYSLVRILGGLFITFAVSYFLAKYIKQQEHVRDDIDLTKRTNQFNIFLNKLFVDSEAEKSNNNPALLVVAWLRLSGKIALLLIPSMIVGTLFTSVLWAFWADAISNNILSVGLISVLGSLLMISTWTEIPLALQMIEKGLTGPAAATLLALPAINLASLWLVGKSSGQWRLALGLYASVILCSFAIGAAFLFSKS